MIDYIEELYNYTRVIPEIKKVIEISRKREFEVLERIWPSITEDIASFCRSIAEMDAQTGSDLWLNFKQASASASGTNKELFADSLERLLPDVYKCIKMYGTIDVTEGNYRILSSDSGYLILQNIKTGRLLNSSVDPMWEAMLFAKKLYNPGYEHFKIIGCEMGYLPYAIYLLYDREIDIYIYNPDSEQVRLAMDYGVLSKIDKGRLHITTGGNLDGLLDDFTYDEAYPDDSIGYYVYEEIPDEFTEEYRNALNYFVSQIYTQLDYKEISLRNFTINKRYSDKTIYDIDSTKLKRNWIVIAAGPSFDDQIDFIKNNKDKCTIIAVSTIYKKMISLGIIPDYIAVSDPQDRTYGHLEGLEDECVPLIMEFTSNWRFGARYKGDKYVFPTNSHPYVEEYFNNRNVKMLYAGGTVTVLAMNAAIELGAKKIHLVGADMGFPGNQSHAKGTMDYAAVETGGLMEVDAVCGGTVHTTRVMNYYREQMEGLLKDNPDVVVINYSSAGAKIKGTVWFRDQVKEA